MKSFPIIQISLFHTILSMIGRYVWEIDKHTTSIFLIGIFAISKQVV